MKVLIIGLLIFSVLGSVLSDDGNTDFTQCKAYLDKINQEIAAKQFNQIDASFRYTIQYSGKMLNDEGDVDKCRSLENMTFVRFTLDAGGLQYYRGYCLNQVCNAEVLNSNPQAAMAELTNIVNTIISLFNKKINNIDGNESGNADDDVKLGDAQANISFYPYQEDDESMANAAFIIGVASISMCLLASIIGPLMKELGEKKKRKNANLDETRYQTLINYAQQGATSLVSNSNSQISRPSNTYSGPVSPTVSITGAQSTTSQISATSGKPRREPLWYKCLQCWNVKENISKMFTLKSNNDDLLVFNGIRSICFMQVIFGHEFYLHMNYMSNPNDLMIAQTKPFILFLFSCLYSVDVFFWLGGFFLSYVVADEKQARNFSMKRPAKTGISFMFAIINRVFRILPCYFVVLMFFWKIAPYSGSSPTWDVFMNSANNCDKRWWQNLLFIDNMFGGQKEKCFGWGWYLSNDFQMFILGMILLIIYQNNRFIGKITIGVCFVAFQTVSIVLSYKWNFKVPMNIMNLAVDHYYDDYYTKPWTRISPYLIGLLFGILYKEHQFDKSKNKKNSILTQIQKLVGHSYWKYASYGLGLIIYFFLVFGPRALQTNGLDYWSTGFQNFWFGTCRTFYVLAVSLLVLPGMLGSKDLIVKFFSCKLFAFLQRLSFGGYLTHYIIILFTLWQSKDAVYYDSENLIGLFFSEFLLTLIASAIVALIIEIPIMNLSGILLGGKKPSSSGPQKLERVKLEDLTAEANKENAKNLNINKSQISDIDSSQISNTNTKSITVQSKQMN